MEKSRRFTFVTESDNLLVTVSERLDPSYGLYTWPSSVVLAQYLWYHRQSLLHKSILELGSGTGLPGIIAILCGNTKSVTLTDDRRQPSCLQNLVSSCQLNHILTSHADINGFYCRRTEHHGAIVTLIALGWGEVPPIFKDHTHHGLSFPDIILGSDCLFDESIFESVLFTVRYLLVKGSEARSQPPRFLCTYQVRSSKISLDYHMLQWGLKYTEIPLQQFCPDQYNIANSGMPGNHNIKMLEIFLALT